VKPVINCADDAWGIIVFLTVTEMNGRKVISSDHQSVDFGISQLLKRSTEKIIVLNIEQINTAVVLTSWEAIQHVKKYHKMSLLYFLQQYLQ